MSATNVLGGMTPVFESLDLITRTGDEISLLEQFSLLTIYEDIYSPCLSGEIVIEDNINLLDNLPIVAQETLRVKFYSYNYDIEKNGDLNVIHRTFNIVRVLDIRQINDYTKEYTLQFVSPEALKNEQTRISRGFKNESISSVVNKIFTNDFDSGEGLGFEYTKEVPFRSDFFISPYLYNTDIETRYEKVDDFDSIEFFVEKTKYTEPQISFPYMKPFDAIDWLASRSIRKSKGRSTLSQERPPANFLFFENKRGYNFLSVDTLLENKDISTTNFFYGDRYQNISNNKVRNIKVDRIEDFQVQKCYDLLHAIRGGMFASRLYNFDLMTGETYVTDYDYEDEFYKSESTERKSDNKKQDFSLLAKNNKQYSKNFLTRQLNIISSPSRSLNIFTSEQSARQNSLYNTLGPEEYLQSRLSLLQRLGYYVSTFTAIGNSKHKVGDMVNININNTISNELTENNKFYSGFYLITSIKHVVTKSEYKMNIEAVKDSYKEELL